MKTENVPQTANLKAQRLAPEVSELMQMLQALDRRMASAPPSGSK